MPDVSVLVENENHEIQAVELDWYAEEEVVRVTPRDQQRFQIQKDRAIKILQLVKESEQFQLQFDLLIRRLAEWVQGHVDKIDSAIVTLQDGLFAFVVVRKATRYDEDFQDALVDLDIDLANDTDLSLIRVKTLALPNVSGDALRSFLDERLTFVFRHGGRIGSHSVSKSEP